MFFVGDEVRINLYSDFSINWPDGGVYSQDKLREYLASSGKSLSDMTFNVIGTHTNSYNDTYLLLKHMDDNYHAVYVVVQDWWIQDCKQVQCPTSIEINTNKSDRLEFKWQGEVVAETTPTGRWISLDKNKFVQALLAVTSELGKMTSYGPPAQKYKLKNTINSLSAKTVALAELGWDKEGK